MTCAHSTPCPCKRLYIIFNARFAIAMKGDFGDDIYWARDINLHEAGDVACLMLACYEGDVPAVEPVTWRIHTPLVDILAVHN